MRWVSVTSLTQHGNIKLSTLPSTYACIQQLQSRPYSLAESAEHILFKRFFFNVVPLCEPYVHCAFTVRYPMFTCQGPPCHGIECLFVWHALHKLLEPCDVVREAQCRSVLFCGETVGWVWQCCRHALL